MRYLPSIFLLVFLSLSGFSADDPVQRRSIPVTPTALLGAWFSHSISVDRGVTHVDSVEFIAKADYTKVTSPAGDIWNISSIVQCNYTEEGMERLSWVYKFTNNVNTWAVHKVPDSDFFRVDFHRPSNDPVNPNAEFGRIIFEIRQ